MMIVTMHEMIEMLLESEDVPEKWVMLYENGSRFMAEVYVATSGPFEGVPTAKWHVDSIDENVVELIQLLPSHTVFEELRRK